METGDLLIPLIFNAIYQTSTAVCVVLFGELRFIERFQLSVPVLRRMVLIGEEQRLVIQAFVLLVILVTTYFEVCQICIRPSTVVYIGLLTFTLVGRIINWQTSSHVGLVQIETPKKWWVAAEDCWWTNAEDGGTRLVERRGREGGCCLEDGHRALNTLVPENRTSPF